MGIRKILKSRKTPEQLLKNWQGKLQHEHRKNEERIKDVEEEEEKVKRAARDATWRHDIVSARELATEIVRSRKTVNCLRQHNRYLNSIILHLGECVAIARTVGKFSKSAEVSKLVGNLMKCPEGSSTVKDFRKEMTKVGVIYDVAHDSVRMGLEQSEVEEVNEEAVDAVLTEIVSMSGSYLQHSFKQERVKPHTERSASLRSMCVRILSKRRFLHTNA